MRKWVWVAAAAAVVCAAPGVAGAQELEVARARQGYYVAFGGGPEVESRTLAQFGKGKVRLALQEVLPIGRRRHAPTSVAAGPQRAYLPSGRAGLPATTASGSTSCVTTTSVTFCS